MRPSLETNHVLATRVGLHLWRHGECGQVQRGQQGSGGLQEREATVVVHHGDFAHAAEQREPLGVERDAEILEEEEEEILMECGLR